MPQTFRRGRKAARKDSAHNFGHVVSYHLVVANAKHVLKMWSLQRSACGTWQAPVAAADFSSGAHCEGSCGGTRSSAQFSVLVYSRPLTCVTMAITTAAHFSALYV